MSQRAVREPAVRVFAHVAHGFGAARWNERYRSGRLVGVNEPYAYGYHQAADMGCTVEYSTDHPYGGPIKLLRLALRAILGFDLVHALRNLDAACSADVVWTHTESQYLAMIAASRLRRRQLPPIIAQSVWLMDGWPAAWDPRRYLYLRLMRRADVLTFLSPLNAARCKELLPAADARVVPFGVGSATALELGPWKQGEPLTVVAVGNDRHRDWARLVSDFTGSPYEVRIVSTKYEPSHALPRNIQVTPARSNDALLEIYRDADVVMVPLKPNLHASGITAVLEGVLAQRPVVVSDEGGLERYFGTGELLFADPSVGGSLRAAVDAVASDPAGARERIAKAHRRTLAEYTTAEYVRRHVELSRELLARRSR